MRSLTRGLIAGATGTLALEAAGYLDIAIRGRPPSLTPLQAVRRLEVALGIDLGENGAGFNRRAAIGALLGYATGLTVAIAYATLVRRRRPWPEVAALLTATAMLASDTPMTLAGITDPRGWTTADWLADLLPHLAYGAATAAVDTRLREVA